jgi:hypothetical protein
LKVKKNNEIKIKFKKYLKKIHIKIKKYLKIKNKLKKLKKNK